MRAFEGCQGKPTGATPREGASRNAFLRDSVILTLATGILNGVSWLYHIVMSRALGPREYGALSALIGLLLVLTVPVNTIQMGISAFVARARAGGSEPAVLSMLHQSLGRVALFGLAAFAVLAVLSRWLAGALRLDSPVPVLAMATILIPWSALPVLRGVLQGMQSFGALGASLATEGVLKLGAGVALVAAGLGVSGAIGGLSLGALGALGLTFFVMRRWLPDRGAPKRAEFGPLLRSLAPYTVVIGCFTVLTQVDVVLVKALFPPHDAGVYAAASAGGKIVLYLTGALPMVMLPETARLDVSSRPGRGVLMQGLTYGGLAGGAVVAAYFLMPAPIIRLMFGSAYEASAPLLGLLGFGMFGYELALISLYYRLATRRLDVLPAVAALTVLFPVLIWAVPRSIQDVALLVAVLGLLTFGLATWSMIPRKQVLMGG